MADQVSRPRTEHLQVGDTLVVVFRNELPFRANIVFDSGLVPDNAATAGTAVQPNATITVRYSVRLLAIPAASTDSADGKESMVQNGCVAAALRLIALQ